MTRPDRDSGQAGDAARRTLAARSAAGRGPGTLGAPAARGSAAPGAAVPVARRAKERTPRAGKEMVPMATVEAMERLSGELYLAGQRAARAEAVAELREHRLTDLQQEVEDLQREATGLWEQNRELLRRLAVAEAQVAARPAAPPARWWARR